MPTITEVKAPSPDFAVAECVRWSGDLTSRTGYRFHVRPISPTDAVDLGSFFTHVSPDDLRFRFLSAVRIVPHQELVALSTMDHRRTENFLAVDPDTGVIIASAMIAADAMAEAREHIGQQHRDHRFVLDHENTQGNQSSASLSRNVSRASGLIVHLAFGRLAKNGRTVSTEPDDRWTMLRRTRAGRISSVMDSLSPVPALWSAAHIRTAGQRRSYHFAHRQNPVCQADRRRRSVLHDDSHSAPAQPHVRIGNYSPAH